MKSAALLIATSLTLASCTNVMNLTNQEYARLCFGATDWLMASMSCESAATKAEREDADPKTIAAYWREHARASGALCSYPRAKTALEKSLILDKSINGPIDVDYFELALMHFEQKLFKEASIYFQSGVAVTTKEVVAQDPIGYAEILNQYSVALRQIGDIANSENIMAESKQLRLSNPNSKALTTLTPYGKFCAQKS